MITAWYEGLDAEKKEELKREFYSSLTIRRRLGKLLDDKMVLSRKSAQGKAAYGSPNWAYLQADNNGYERALNEIISLLEVEKVTNY